MTVQLTHYRFLNPIHIDSDDDHEKLEGKQKVNCLQDIINLIVCAPI